MSRNKIIMGVENHGKGNKADLKNEYNALAFHPKNVILTLVLFGLTVLFLALSASYVYSRIQQDLPPLKVPCLFMINTIFIIGSSIAMIRAKKAFLLDDTATYKNAIRITIGLSALFILLQFVAWQQLTSQEIFVNSNNSSGFLYVLSGLHLLHVFAGIPFLAWFLQQANRDTKEQVGVLIYFSDPEKKLHLQLLNTYWLFLDFAWLFLLAFFYIMSWIN